MKVVLYSIIISKFTTGAFSSTGPREDLLIEASGPLVETFEAICKALTDPSVKSFSDVPSELTRGFPGKLFEYLKRFHDWKSTEEVTTVNRIKEALLAMITAQATLERSAQGQSQLYDQFTLQIDKLRNMLRQVIGQRALQDFEQQGNSPPAVLVEAADSVVSAPTAEASIDDICNEDLEFRPISSAIETNNEEIVFSILVNPDFRFTAENCKNKKSHVHSFPDYEHRSFWDSIVEGLNHPETPDFTSVFQVMDEIRAKLEVLVPPAEAQTVATILDVRSVKAKVAGGCFSWGEGREMVTSVMRMITRTQIVTRDDETRSLWAGVQETLNDTTPGGGAKAFCHALEFLLNRVDMIRLDKTNARFIRTRSVVSGDHAYDYLTLKFNDKVVDGKLTTNVTRAWLKKILEWQSSNGDTEDTIAVGMLDLVTDTEPLAKENCPETFHLCLSNLQEIQSDLKYFATSASVLVKSTGYLMPENSGLLERISGCLIQRDSDDVRKVFRLFLDSVISVPLSAVVFLQNIDLMLTDDSLPMAATSLMKTSLTHSSVKTPLDATLAQISDKKDVVNQLM